MNINIKLTESNELDTPFALYEHEISTAGFRGPAKAAFSYKNVEDEYL